MLLRDIKCHLVIDEHSKIFIYDRKIGIFKLFIRSSQWHFFIKDLPFFQLSHFCCKLRINQFYRQKCFETFSFVIQAAILNQMRLKIMIIGSNLHWQGTWTKAVFAGGEARCVTAQWCVHWGCNFAQYIQAGGLG